MKVLGITCGRKMSNTEILVKEGLMGAKDAGAEVELIRLMDLNLKPCTGCNACVIDLLEKAGSGKCPIKDDLAFIDEKIMEADALIVGSPIYEKSITGYLKTLNDRMGPSHDLAMRIIANKIREEKGITDDRGPDPRAFKPRVASLFAIGGSDWTEFTLPMLQLFVLPFQIKVVDQQLFNWIALPGVASLHDEMLERARKSGAHIVESLKVGVEKAEYIGPEGLCTECHTSLLQVSEDSSAVCSVCGTQGKLVQEGGKMVFKADEQSLAVAHTRIEGKFHHVDDLKNRSLKPLPNMHEIPEKLKNYKEFIGYSKPE